jgi:hypothetical protein
MPPLAGFGPNAAAIAALWWSPPSPGFLSIFPTRLTHSQLPSAAGASLHRRLPPELVNATGNVATEAAIATPL